MSSKTTIITPARAEASRRNGRKSRGPVTPEGKAISSRNAQTHGITAKSRPATPDGPGPARLVLLANEDPAQFDALHQANVQTFAPANRSELETVYALSSELWRRRRIWSNETALTDVAMSKMAAGLARKYLTLNEPTRSALAFERLARNGVAHLFPRYYAELSRSIYRTIQTLLALRKAQQRNEPERDPASPTQTEAV